MAFDNATRRKIVQLTTQSKPTGGGTVTFQLPRTGLLARVYLKIRGTVSGTVTTANALGFSSIIRRVRLTANSGIDVFNMSGAGYHYLYHNMQEDEHDVAPQSDGQVAVTATTFNLDMVIPIQINQRDPVGLIMLQSEQTVLTLTVDFEADSGVVLSGGGTLVATVTPYLELFTVPVDSADWPPLNMVHQTLEDATAVAATGEFTYTWPRGNTYLQVIHGLGYGHTPSDDVDRVQVRLNQSDYLIDVDVDWFDLERNYSAGTPRNIGQFPIDLMGSAGLGMYDKMRDTINSALVTDLATVLNATATGTLTTVRRQLVMLS